MLVKIITDGKDKLLMLVMINKINNDD